MDTLLKKGLKTTVGTMRINLKIKLSVLQRRNLF